jgi:hypothetical protein
MFSRFEFTSLQKAPTSRIPHQQHPNNTWTRTSVTMAANNPNHSSQMQPFINLILQQQATEDAQSRRLELRGSTTRFCKGIIQSATVLDASDSKTLTDFHGFSKLPTELRASICEYFETKAWVWYYAPERGSQWPHLDEQMILIIFDQNELSLMRGLIGRAAIDCPRFIEFRKVQSWNRSLFAATPPPIFYRVCKESYEEVDRAYAAYYNATPIRVAEYSIDIRWVRFDRDIIHIKPLPRPSRRAMMHMGGRPISLPSARTPDLAQLSDIFAKPGRSNPIQQYRRLSNYVDTDKWLGRPEHFDKITSLAISRDLLVHLPDDYAPFFRHFFPNILIIIVLIDDEIDIDKEWGIHDLKYGRYERLSEKSRTSEYSRNTPRLGFAKKCKGPFQEVKVNVDYRMEIEYEMRNRFEKEEEKYLCKHSTSPCQVDLSYPGYLAGSKVTVSIVQIF